MIPLHEAADRPIRTVDPNAVGLLPEVKARIIDHWTRTTNVLIAPPERFYSGLPLLGSQALRRRLDTKLGDLMSHLRPHLESCSDPLWPRLGPADVVAVDMALVRDGSADGGWDLRLVEFQAFTSLVATCYTLSLANEEIWPDLRGCTAWDPLDDGLPWLDVVRQWLAPVDGTVLVDVNPSEQRTLFDFRALSHWFGVSIADPHDLAYEAGAAVVRTGMSEARPVRRVLNRAILHEAADPERLRQRLAELPVTWHSHPAWYYRANKGLMTKLPLSAGDRCVTADDWRSLELPPEALVLKRANSYSGAAVFFPSDASTLDDVDRAEDWIVQPKFDPFPISLAPGLPPVFAEIRCIMALRPGRKPWNSMRNVRMYRGRQAGMGHWLGLPGEGSSLLYFPK